MIDDRRLCRKCIKLFFGVGAFVHKKLQLFRRKCEYYEKKIDCNNNCCDSMCNDGM